jgi:hypothetical protein
MQQAMSVGGAREVVMYFSLRTLQRLLLELDGHVVFALIL